MTCALTLPSFSPQHAVTDGDICITCPRPDCDGKFTAAAMQTALEDDPRALRRFHELQAESLMRKPLHCPYKDCSELMDVHGMDDCTPMACSRCRRELCLRCKVPFHSGLSCEQFQALPPEHRNKEDLELLHLAHAERWRRCPACDHLVERELGGCNFLLCRCKHAFCYACGVAYLHTQRTANNRHGQPGCRCGLFDQPPPELAEPAAGVVALAQQLRNPRAPPHIVSLRKGRAQLRNGRRWVKRIRENEFYVPVPEWGPAGPKRCNKSRTHAGCPYGVGCWFLHPQDDLPFDDDDDDDFSD